MLCEYGDRDAAAAKDLAEDLQSMGSVGDCNVFLFAMQSASLEVEDLSTHGPAANASIFAPQALRKTSGSIRSCGARRVKKWSKDGYLRSVKTKRLLPAGC